MCRVLQKNRIRRGRGVGARGSGGRDVPPSAVCTPGPQATVSLSPKACDPGEPMTHVPAQGPETARAAPAQRAAHERAELPLSPPSVPSGPPVGGRRRPAPGAPPPDEAAASNAALVRTPPGPRLAQTRPETATSNPGARPGGSTHGINPHRVVPTFTSRTSLVPFPSPGTPDPPTPISSWEVLPHCALLSPGTLAPRCPRGERRPRLGLLCASVATMTVSSRVPSSSSSRVNTRLIPAKPASR